MTLTTKELQTVQTLIRLGDSEALAVKTVVAGRETEAMKQAQLENKTYLET